MSNVEAPQPSNKQRTSVSTKIKNENVPLVINPEEIEKKQLSQQIGIDYEIEKEKYNWFLSQISNLELPFGWTKKEKNETIYYYNKQLKIKSDKHPNLGRFRLIFQEILDDEPKLVSNDPESQNLIATTTIRPDEKTKIRTKAVTVSKTIKDQKLGSSIPIELFEPGKNKERYQALKKQLENKRQIPSLIEARFISLDECENILDRTKKYYQQLYGRYIVEVPSELDELYDHNQTTPAEIYNSIKILNINTKDPHLFWLAKLYSIIPLPPFWKKNFNYNLSQETYINMEENIEIPVHPSCKYLLDQILYHKNENIKSTNAILDMKRMKFYDKLNRPYEIDLVAYINETANDNIEKQDKKNTNPYKVINLAYNEDLKKDDISEANLRNSMFDLNNNLKDRILLAITRQCGLELKSNLHLLSLIEDFVKNKEKNDSWFFRGSPNGEFYWINHQVKKSSKLYPHIDELKTYVVAYKTEFDRIIKNTHKFLKNEKTLKTIFLNKEENINEIIKKEMIRFTEWFLNNIKKDKQKSSSQIKYEDDNKLRERKSLSQSKIMQESRSDKIVENGNYYDASEFASLLGLSKVDLDSDDILNLILYCSFDLEINCNHRDELKIFKSPEKILYKRLKEKLKQRKKEETTKNEIENDQISDEDFEINYDSDSIKSTESIHEARKKIENPRKIISLLNNLNAINLNDPVEKAEFLKNLVDFEEKYGKLDEDEEEGHTTKRNSNLNTDRNKKTNEKQPEISVEKKDFIKEEIQKMLQIDEKSPEKIDSEKEKGEMMNFDILKKLDNLKKNYDELIVTENLALESMVKEQNQGELKLDKHLLLTNENIEKDLLFLTNPADLIKTEEKSNESKLKSNLKTEENKSIVTKQSENTKTETSKEMNVLQGEDKKINNIEKQSETQGLSKKIRNISEKNEKSTLKNQEKEVAAKESFHSKNSKNSKNARNSINTLSKINENENIKKEKQSDFKEKSKIDNKKLLNNDENIKNMIKNHHILDTKKEVETSNNLENNDNKNIKTVKNGEDIKEIQENHIDKKKNIIKTQKEKISKADIKRKMPTLDLDGLKSKKLGKLKQVKSFSQKDIASLESGGNQSESENYGNLSDLTNSIHLDEGESERKRIIISKESELNSENFEKDNKMTLSSSAQSDPNGNLEDNYEIIEDNILDEDLELLIKTSDKNEILNEFKTEETKKELSQARKKLIKKLEKKFGKNNVKSKIKQIEKQIEKASRNEKLNENELETVKFSALDSIENKLFDNFYKTQNDQNIDNLKKPTNSFGEVLRKKLMEKLGINENEQNVVLTEFGNKMWEIKKRLNNHMAYLKKKLFFEKLDELFIQIMIERKMTSLRIKSKEDKKKIQNILILLKPFIFSSIANNNMIFDGIKILFISKNSSNNPTSVKKLRSLLKKVKSNLAKILSESIKNVYAKNRANFQFVEIFPYENIDGKNLNEANDTFLKTQNNLKKVIEENQFSDIKMRIKPEHNKKSLDLSHKKIEFNMAKTNINFPIKTNMRKENLKNSIGFKHTFSQSMNINIDKICYFYLDRLNISEKKKEFFLYYLTHLADPSHLDHNLIDNLLYNNDGVNPHHVYKMSKRIGINLIENNEIDLVWIAYIMLIYPLPENSIKQNFTYRNEEYFDFLCTIPINEHPGDIFFSKVLESHRRKRAAFINNHSGCQKFQIAMSWLKFYKKTLYFYNFYFDKSETNIPKLYEDYIKFIRKLFQKKLNDQHRFDKKEAFTITSILELDRFTSL